MPWAAGLLLLTLGATGVLVVAAIPHGSWLQGLADQSARWRAFARAHPGLGVCAFVLAYATAIVCFLPVALVMTVAGGFLFGPWVGAAASISGATLGASVSYGLARSTLGLGSADRLKARHPRALQMIAGLRRNAFSFTLAMRLLPLTPFTLVSMAAGGARAPIGKFLLGTALGVVPECVLYSAAGRGVGALLLTDRRISMSDLVHPGFLWPLAAIGTLCLLTPLVRRRLRDT